MSVQPLKFQNGAIARFQPGDVMDPSAVPTVVVSARAPAYDVIVPQSYSAVISSDYEIVAGKVTELGPDATLEVT